MLRIGQVETTATSDSKYTDGSVAGGIAATRLRAAAFNAIQEELANIVESAGLVLSINDQTQVLAGLKKLFLSRSAPFADIKADGSAAIATALSNLGLGAGAPPIGIPFFWPSSAMPNTVMTEWADMVFLKFNGATFSASTYPKLALVFPGLVLTEARGEFLRIWDDGRGVDSGRALLSAQSDDFKSHTHRLYFNNGSSGSNISIGSSSNVTGIYSSGLNQPGGGSIAAIENTGGTETRPRNIAFNFLVRAK